MCRWLAYSGTTVPLHDLLFAPAHNLIDQSMSSRSAETPTNGDGFGVGWYGRLEDPGLFRSIRPAWNDFNLRDLAVQVEAHTILAHVRATSMATVQETNCHPFRWGRWLFVHNGEIFEIEKVRRDLLMAVDPSLFTLIQGTTDSEVLFYLAITFGLADDPLGALQRAAGFVEQVGRSHGIDESLWATFCVSDGHALWAARYASDGEAPTLFRSPDIAQLAALRPDVADRFGEESVAIVSEPLGQFGHIWKPIPQSTAIVVRDGQVTLTPFAPAA